MRETDTDVQTQTGRQTARHGASTSTHPPGRVGTSAWAGELLGRWQPAEVRVARGFPECRGLAAEQLEDLYQDTTLALLSRPYTSEEHLRNALRHGIKHRALNLHRNQRRRTQILTHNAPSMQRIEEGRHSHTGPEETALSEQDRLIAAEFLSELDELEQRVFRLTAEGMRYRAIASALQIPVNQARHASRSSERKRQRFQLLYDTGRLCGYRAATIESLQAGELTDEELARRAFAHLDACASCRTEHRTNAKRLGRTLAGQLAALLPLPGLLGRLARPGRSWLRAGAHLGSGARERAGALLAAGGASAKITAGVATVTVIVGGTIGATHALEHHATHPDRHPAPAATGAAPDARDTSPPVPHVRAIVHRAPPHRPSPHPHVAAYGAANLNRSASGGPPTAPQANQREFGPEAPSTGPTSRLETGRPRVAGNGEAAYREFGTAAGGQ